MAVRSIADAVAALGIADRGPLFALGEREQAAALGMEPMPRLDHTQLLDLARLRFGGDHVLFEFPDEGSALTVDQLERASIAFATALSEAGLRRGDALAIWSPPAPLWPTAMWGAARLGVRVCGLNTRYRPAELRQVLDVLDPSLVLVANGFLDIDSPALVAEALGSRSSRILVSAVGDPTGGLCEPNRGGEAAHPPTRLPHDEPALVQFTSGSTAAPKGVLITQSGSVAAAHYGAEAMGIGPGDRMYSPLPFFHIGGTITTALAAVTSGCTMVVPRRFAPDAALDALAAGCTGFQGHGALWRILVDAHHEAPRPLPALRRGWASGDARFLAEVRDVLGVADLVDMYGSSEAGTISCTLPVDPEDVRLGTLGHPTPGTTVRVLVPGSEQEVEPGEVGELALSGPMVMRGYLGHEPVDGSFRTGDLVTFDGSVLRHAGRVDDRLKPGGENVSVVEVESFIRTDPEVGDVVVVGVPDRRLGEVPAAVVRPARAGEEAADLERRIGERCREGLAGFKAPRYVHVVPSLPMLDSGKIDRRMVRAQLLRYLGMEEAA